MQLTVAELSQLLDDARRLGAQDAADKRATRLDEDYAYVTTNGVRPDKLIEAIRRVRGHTGLGLKVSKHFIEGTAVLCLPKSVAGRVKESVEEIGPTEVRVVGHVMGEVL